MINKPVIALVLIVAVLALWGTPSGINVDGLRVNAESRNISSSFDALSIAESNYQSKYKKSLTVANWRSEVVQSGSRVPGFPGFTLSYGETAGQGRYFCITSDAGASSHATKVVPRSQTRLSDDGGYVSYINENCGSTDDGDVADIDDWANYTLTVYTGS